MRARGRPFNGEGVAGTRLAGGGARRRAEPAGSTWETLRSVGDA